MTALSVQEEARVQLGHALQDVGYEFVTVTPATHARVNARLENAEAKSLRDVFGWSRPFKPDTMPAEILRLLDLANALDSAGDGLLKSRLRFSSAGAAIVAHSAFPTHAADSVFFGPDTYRFLRLLKRVFKPGERVVEIGAGSGIPGLSLNAKAKKITLGDVSSNALSFCRVNAALAGVQDVEILESDVLAGVTGPVDRIIANPPFLVDAASRTYRDGGGTLGTGMTLRIVRESLERLVPGGQLVLYTGAPVLDGQDVLRAALEPLKKPHPRWTYEELDPDIFGEELDEPPYAKVDRLAATALVIETQ